MGCASTAEQPSTVFFPIGKGLVGHMIKTRNDAVVVRGTDLHASSSVYDKEIDGRCCCDISLDALPQLWLIGTWVLPPPPTTDRSTIAVIIHVMDRSSSGTRTMSLLFLLLISSIIMFHDDAQLENDEAGLVYVL